MAFNFHDFKEPHALESVTYVGRYMSIGAFKKPVHSFKDANDVVFHVWGSSVLNHILYGVPFGTVLNLIYKGMGMLDESTHPLKLFDIQIIDVADLPKKQKKPAKKAKPDENLTIAPE